MKILPLLLEYDHSITLQKFANQLAEPARKNDTNAANALKSLEKIDPTTNKQFTLWLIKQFIKGQFRLEDSSRVQQVLQNFASVKNRLPVEQRDIGRFDFYKLDELVDSIFNVDLEKTSTNSNTSRVIPEDSEVLYNGPLGLLVIPKSQEASCELGRGTKWCTAARNDNKFSYYSYHGPLYIWIDKSGEKYQFHFETTQFMDDKDRPIDTKLLKYFRTEHSVLKKLFKEKEKEIAKDPERAYQYATDVIRGKFPEGEAAIVKYAYYSYFYALHAIGGRFPEGEAAIAKDAEHSYMYARNVIKDRFPEGEAAIAKDAYYSYHYARKVINGRFPEGEAAIAKSPIWWDNYKPIVSGNKWDPL